MSSNMRNTILAATMLCAITTLPAAQDVLEFTSIVPLNSEAATDRKEDMDNDVEIASNGDVYIAVWTLDPTDCGPDVLTARSTDSGATWQPQMPLNAGGRNWAEQNPSIAVNEDGTWMALWESSHNVDGLGVDWDIVGAISTDDGLTWSAPFPVNDDATTDSTGESEPHVAAGPNGTWVATWTDTDSGTDIAISRSTNDGASWSPIQLFNKTGADRSPRVATRGGGVWVVVAQAVGGAGFNDVVFTRSTDDGVTWAALEVLNSSNDSPILAHETPDIAFDNDGNAIVTWMIRANSNDGNIPTYDPYFSTSIDGGLTWSDQLPLYANPLDLRSTSFSPRIASDGDDNWVVNWTSTKRHITGYGGDQEVWYAYTVNDGSAWSSPRPLRLDMNMDGTFPDFDNAIVSNRKGTWISGWSTFKGEFGNPPNFVDDDIFSVRGFFTGFIRGKVTRSDNDMPVGSASLRIRNTDLGVERIAVTDRRGDYEVANLPAGTYDIEVWGAEITVPEYAFREEQATVFAGAVTKTNFSVTFQPLVGGVQGTVFGQVTPGSSVNRVPLVGVRVDTFAPTGPGGSEEFVSTTYSTGDGTYVVNDVITAKGTPGVQVRVNFDAEGFVNDDRLPVIPPGGAAESNPTLEQKAIGFAASLSGAITRADTNGSLEGALVEIEGPVRVSRISESGGGTYVFDALPSSNYVARISKLGFITEERAVSVPGNEANILNVALEVDEGGIIELTDINGDGVVNSLDIQLVINAVLGINLGGFDADVNGDNTRNSIDIQVVVNKVLGL